MTTTHPASAGLGFEQTAPPDSSGGAFFERDEMENHECPRVEQTQVYVKDVSRGNCFSAMIAGMLKIPIERVPLFGSESGKPWQHNVNEFLRPYGLAWLPLDGNDFPIECVQYGIKGVWHEIAGESARGVGHSCAAKDGALAWDPHPSQSGLEKIWWHGIFIALRPWELTHPQEWEPTSEEIKDASDWVSDEIRKYQSP